MPSLPITATVPWIQYTATPAQTVFPVPYIFFATTDLQVYYSPVGTTPSDITNLLVINVGYTVTLNVNTYTGSITLTVPANAGDLITIVRNMPNTRTNYYIQGGAITPDTLNTNDSSEVLMIQQNNYVVNNRIPRYEFVNQPIYPNDILLPLLGPNQTWVKDPTNTFIEAADIPAGAVLLPTVTNHIATFSDAFGTLQSSAGVITAAIISGLTWQGAIISPTFGGSGVANPTIHGVLIGEGINPYHSVVLGAGQVLIGTTALDPVAAALTAGTGITITPASGSITIAVTGGAAVTSVTGTAPIASTGGTTPDISLNGTATPAQVLMSLTGTSTQYSTATYPLSTTINRLLYSSAANTITDLATVNSSQLVTNNAGVPVWGPTMTNGQIVIGNTGATPTVATLTAGAGIGIATGAGTITITNTAAAAAWIDQIATPVTMTANDSYIADTAGLLTFNMPALAAQGTEFQVAGNGAGGWLIQFAAGQTGHLDSTATSIAGSFASTNQYNGITLLCTVANTTFVVVASTGVITVA